MGVHEHVVGLGGEAHHVLVGALARGQGGQDVGVLREGHVGERRIVAALLQLAVGRVRRAQVGHSGGEDGGIGGREHRRSGGQHVAGRLHGHHFHAIRCGEGHRARHEHHPRAGGRGRLGDGIAHLARGVIRNVAHRVDGFHRRASRHEHRAARERARGHRGRAIGHGGRQRGVGNGSSWEILRLRAFGALLGIARGGSACGSVLSGRRRSRRARSIDLLHHGRERHLTVLLTGLPQGVQAHALGQQDQRLAHDDSGIGQTTATHIAAGQIARAPFDEAHAPAAQRGHVLLGGRRLVHMHVGRRRDGQRRRGRQGRRGKQVVGNAAGHLRHYIGRARRDKEHVAFLSERNMVNGIGRIVEQIHRHFLVGKRPEGHGIDEVRAVLGHDHLHPHARLLQPAHDFPGLVGRNAPGHSHQYARPLHTHRPLLPRSFPPIIGEPTG